MSRDDFAYSGTDNLEAMAEAVRYNRFLVDQVIEALPQDVDRPSVVDFGAGTGTYALMLRERGITALCTEIDASQRATMDAAGLPTVAEIADVAAGSADLVYALNVFEHIEDDGAAIRETVRALKPGGRLLIYVPAFMSIFSSMDRKVGHFRRYRRKHLVALVESAGLRVVRARYCDPLGYLAALVFKIFGNRSGTISPASVRLYDRVAFPISHALEPIFARMFGKNVVVVGERVAD